MNNIPLMNFASENYAGVHPEIMQALAAANTGFAPSYGNDAITADAVKLFKEIFGEDIDIYFVFNGTGANNFGISCVTERYSSIYCSDVAHLYVDESTAPESFLGCRIYPVKSADGKIVYSELKNAIKRAGDVHHPQPRVVSITQPTEYGTVYTPDEISAIKSLCDENHLTLHVDGARFFNAADALGLSLPQMCKGTDVLTLGGTKAGMLFGEAVIFFQPDKNHARKYNLKRSMQLASKNRFIAAQFMAMLQNGVWQHIARHTNQLAKAFEQAVAGIPGVKVAYPVETNAVFLNMPYALYEKLQAHAKFYHWNEQRDEIRLMFSFDSTMEEVDRMAGLTKTFAGELGLS